MLQRMLIVAALAALAQATEAPSPSGFYIVSVFFSEAGPHYYYRVLDVRRDGADSVVRYIRVAPESLICPRVIVQAAETRLRDRSPADLVGADNPCAIDPRSFRAALKRYQQTIGTLETISFGIVAQCGETPVSLAVPIAERVKMTQMKAAHPEFAALWDLEAKVFGAVYGDRDIFDDRTDEEEMAFQDAGAKLVPELVSGRYDLGLAAGMGGSGRSPTFRSVLAGYRGPASSAEGPQIVDRQSYQFNHFLPPKYPALAMAAAISGTVKLRLTVEPSTGEVKDVAIISGHPILTTTVIAAAKQWRFAPNSVQSGSALVTLNFAYHCQ